MLDRKIRKRVEYAFYNYKTLKEQGANYIVELAESGLTARLDGVGGSSGKSNPTEAKGIKAADYNAMLWCKVVERTKARFASDINKIDMLNFKYTKKWGADRICTELYITRMTLYNWLDDVLTYAAMLAIQERIIKL